MNATALFTAGLLTALPAFAFAAGSVATPPTPTESTTVCTEGMVFDTETKTCITPTEGQESGLLNDDDLMQAVREFAYAGQYGAARDILPLLDQNDDLVQTYWGFTARKMGNMDQAMQHYQAALTLNADNLLVRSYLGQAFVTLGQIDAAKDQLREIKARGGTQTWPAIALNTAIRTGQGYSY